MAFLKFGFYLPALAVLSEATAIQIMKTVNFPQKTYFSQNLALPH
jgi:hypothetical protein